MFLDDSACNLASINLMKFVNEDGTFNIEGFRHAVTVFTVAMEIIVDFASYPTQAIAEQSHDYRPLGLGYANLGTLLMVNGIPYDSDAGRSRAAAISAILTGRAYATSAEIAARKGPFAGYARNAASMLGVMGMHRDAAYAIPAPDCPASLLTAAREDWDRAVALGEHHGYRNAQATVIAPTGTIGLLMDCDTTGIEPDFALVKFKKLAGGGYFKIVNRSVNRALETLGYSTDQIADILRYVTGTLSLSGAPHVNRVALRERGLAEEDIDRIEQALPGVFDLRHAFTASALGPGTLARLGLSAADARKPGFDLLTRLNFSAGEIAEAEEVICGRMTIEGAPHVAPEHLPVFDCANRCGRDGRRFIDPLGHVRMMAAVQPFISGAISKTINMPEETTVENVHRTYMESWRLGLKAVALYRDGCKRSQPLSSSSGENGGAKAAATPDDSAVAAHASSDAGGNGSNGGGHPAAAIVAPASAGAGPARSLRRQRLPKKRRGFTQEARIGTNKVYLRTGEYPDGRLGEIFIDMHKEGAAFRSIMNCFAISVSLGLQHGVPLDEYVDAFVFTRFDPQGPVDHPNIKFATSVVDYIFRLLGMEYLRRNDFVHIEPADVDTAEEKVAEVNAARAVETKRAAAPGAAGGAVAGATGTTALERQMRTLMGDAPFCDICGHITVRNGTCYKCLNCGNTMGCS
jgi:ribonucleoside-diphosphate reductase alpha chain